MRRRAADTLGSLSTPRLQLENANRLDTSGEGGGEDDEEQLALQNKRLRDALIRLREQASEEKNDLTKRLRASEKVTASAEAATKELEDLRAQREKANAELSELKEYIDSASSFEEVRGHQAEKAGWRDVALTPWAPPSLVADG